LVLIMKLFGMLHIIIFLKIESKLKILSKKKSKIDKNVE